MVYYLVYLLDEANDPCQDYIGYSKSEYVAKEYYCGMKNMFSSHEVRFVKAECETPEDLAYVGELYATRVDISEIHDELQIYHAEDNSVSTITTNQILSTFVRDLRENPEGYLGTRWNMGTSDIEADANKYNSLCYSLEERKFMRDSSLKDSILQLIRLMRTQYLCIDLIYNDIIDFIKFGILNDEFYPIYGGK